MLTEENSSDRRVDNATINGTPKDRSLSSFDETKFRFERIAYREVVAIREACCVAVYITAAIIVVLALWGAYEFFSWLVGL